MLAANVIDRCRHEDGRHAAHQIGCVCRGSPYDGWDPVRGASSTFLVMLHGGRVSSVTCILARRGKCYGGRGTE